MRWSFQITIEYRCFTHTLRWRSSQIKSGSMKAQAWVLSSCSPCYAGAGKKNAIRRSPWKDMWSSQYWCHSLLIKKMFCESNHNDQQTWSFERKAGSLRVGTPQPPGMLGEWQWPENLAALRRNQCGRKGCTERTWDPLCWREIHKDRLRW